MSTIWVKVLEFIIDVIHIGFLVEEHRKPLSMINTSASMGLLTGHGLERMRGER